MLLWRLRHGVRDFSLLPSLHSESPPGFWNDALSGNRVSMGINIVPFKTAISGTYSPFSATPLYDMGYGCRNTTSSQDMNTIETLSSPLQLRPAALRSLCQVHGKSHLVGSNAGYGFWFNGWFLWVKSHGWKLKPCFLPPNVKGKPCILYNTE